MEVNGNFAIQCRWCERVSNCRSGILKHEKSAHLREFFYPSSSSSQGSSCDDYSDSDSCLSSEISGESLEANNFDSEPEIDLTHMDPINSDIGKCDNFYLNAQMEAVSSGKRLDETVSSRRSMLLKFSELVAQLEISHDKVDLLLGFFHSSAYKFNELPKSWATYERELAMFLGEGTFEGHSAYGDGEMKVAFDIGEVNRLAPSVSIVKRSNALTAVLKVVLDANLSQPGNMNFAPVRLLTKDGERAYGDPWTGNWWKRLCSHYVSPGCVPLVLKLFTDGTICGKTKSRTPVMATVVNMRRSVQRASCGKTYLAFVPQVRVHKVSQAKAADMRYRVKQEVYKLILDDIRPLGTSRFSLMVQGEVQQLQVFVENLILDGPEQRQATGIKSACNRCHCPKDKFGADWEELAVHERAPRVVEAARAAMEECYPLMSSVPRPRGAVQAVNGVLEPLNLRFGRNHTWDYPFATPGGVYAATATDRMHLIQGLIQNLMFVLESIFEAESPNPAKPEAYKQTKHDFLDARFALIAPFVTPEVYLPRFANGFYSKNVREAWHITAWLSLIPFVIDDNDAVIKSSAKRAIFIVNAVLLMRVVYPMWVFTTFTESEVSTLEDNISKWRVHFRENYSIYVKCTHEKFHKILHVPEDIREHGAPGNHCTNTWEQGHAKVKSKDRMTNNRFVPELQIMKLLRVQEHFERGHQDAESTARAMFSVL
jgi:hypothetical protein